MPEQDDGAQRGEAINRSRELEESLSNALLSLAVSLLIYVITESPRYAALSMTILWAVPLLLIKLGALLSQGIRSSRRVFRRHSCARRPIVITQIGAS
jgi:hypothetical protein